MRTSVLLLMAACTGGEAPEPVGLTTMPLPARLAHQADAAALIQAPVDAPPAEVLAAFSFDTGLPEGWRAELPGAAGESEAEIGITADAPIEGLAALSISLAPGLRRDVPSVSGLVPVDGGEHLRVRIQLRARGLDPGIGAMTGGGIVVEEMGGALEEDVLRVHDDLPRVLGDTDWTAASVALQTLPGTRSLRITLAAGPQLVGGSADFDDLLVERFPPEAANRQGRPLTPTAHPMSREVTLDGDTRPSLLAPDATTWGMAVARDTPVELRAGFGRLPGSSPEVEICYEVSHAGASVLATG
ncbi:MAG: hypothetical protein VX265_05165, partial [Myxococcota bacterium]|nr:hypothetical protein [Myxococcota bacterium]